MANRPKVHCTVEWMEAAPSNRRRVSNVVEVRLRYQHLLLVVAEAQLAACALGASCDSFGMTPTLRQAVEKHKRVVPRPITQPDNWTATHEEIALRVRQHLYAVIGVNNDNLIAYP
jgi:hypothetical protein